MSIQIVLALVLQYIELVCSFTTINRPYSPMPAILIFTIMSLPSQSSIARIYPEE